MKRYLSHQDVSSQKKFSATFFVRCRRHHLGSVKQKTYSRLTVVDSNINSPKVKCVTFLRSDRLFSFINISKFDSFKNNFPVITSLSNFHLDAEGLFS